MCRRRWRTFWLLAFVALAAHLPSLQGVLPGAMPSTGDALGAFIPWDTFIRRCLAQDGSIPIWNPHLYAGLPFLANGQSGLFYPPNLLHFLLPENLGLWLLAYGHSLFYMVGGYFLGRTLGLKRRASFLVAVLMGLGNANPAHLYGGHLTFLPARSYWPWEVAFLLRFLQGGSVRNAISWAACISLSLAAGAPQIWLFGVLFNVGVFLAWCARRLLKRQFSIPFRATSVIVAFGLCILWCAPILLPLRELRDWSSHGTELSFAEVTSLSATGRSLFRFLLNDFFGGNSFVMWSLPSNPTEDAASLGFAPLLLALGAPFWARRGRVAVGALFAGMLITVVLSFGAGTPAYYFLYQHVLLFQITRVPARWLELSALSAAILAGFSFDGLLRRPQLAAHLKWLWVGAFAFCLLLGVWVLANSGFGENGAFIVQKAMSLGTGALPSITAQLRHKALISCVVSGTVLGASFFCWRGGLIKSRVVTLAVILLVAEPLVNFWFSTRVSLPPAVAAASIPPSLLRLHKPDERWIIRAPFEKLNAPLTAGIDALNGYEPLGSRPFFEYANAAQGRTDFSADFRPRSLVPLWRVAGVSGVLWKPMGGGPDPRLMLGGQNLHFVAESGGWQLFDWDDGLTPWPRAYLSLPREQNGMSWDNLMASAARPFQPMPDASVSELSSSTDAQNWNTSCNEAVFFVDNEMLAPGWKAFVDGHPAALKPANMVFRGVPLDAGKHRVALVLDSQTLRFSLFLAFGGLSLAAALVIGELQSRRKFL